jgi:hypothetical protein
MTILLSQNPISEDVHSYGRNHPRRKYGPPKCSNDYFASQNPISEDVHSYGRNHPRRKYGPPKCFNDYFASQNPTSEDVQSCGVSSHRKTHGGLLNALMTMTVNNGSIGFIRITSLVLFSGRV